MRRLIAAGFGLGLVLRRVRGSDSGSGTLASLPALLAAVALHRVGWGAQLVVAAVAVGLSIWAAEPYSVTDGGSADPGWVVVDEVAGTLVATIGLGGWTAVVAWAVFRAADVWKEAFPGVAASERIPGGLGVTADDVIAGLYGLAAGWLVATLLPV